MFTDSEYKKLARLLDNLYICSGVKFSLLDETYRQYYTSSYKTDFCRCIENQEGGYERCLKCDRNAIIEMNKTGKSNQYRCHAGLVEVAIPVVDNSKTITTILFGQILDSSSLEEQWETTQKLCSWYPNREELYAAFLRLKRLSDEQIKAYSEIVLSCISEVRLASIVAGVSNNDIQKLESYINSHYSHFNILENACNTLNMGKTKIYKLCKQRYNESFGKVIMNKRIEEAANIIIQTSFPISYIAEIVGIEDFNYFSKLFKNYHGISPSKYRKINSTSK